jgi:hypothetical protein
VTYLLTQTSWSILPVGCKNPTTRSGEIYCNFYFTVETGSKLIPTWYEASRQTSLVDNGGTIYVDIYGCPSTANYVSDVVDIFDVDTNQRTSGSFLAEARTKLASATTNSIAVFAGGYGTNYSKMVDIYDDIAGKWSHIEGLSQARGDLQAASYGNLVVFAGGFSATGFSDVIDIYQVDTNTWRTLSMKTPRMGHGIGYVNNNWLIGGGRISGLNLNSIERLNVTESPCPYCPCSSYLML